ncbi:MAG: RdgB/HAM1 family non-canonical purine NTP pyrophosphatase [Zetaproteobacteria bacterium]|nr:MAG: RdgB/HAM1 family non-canonical purine NTP pyrophosphatase [Zetaproteobacteria bacterium]
MKLVIASNNTKKRQEIVAILATVGVRCVAAHDTRFVPVQEIGTSFAENARLKAKSFAQANGLPALADDSGLCVQALNGAPGIYSSRFAGPSATDEDNCRKLLDAMRGKQDRRAYFICAVHLAFPDGRAPITSEGRVEGFILEACAGQGGFGYDPLFFSPELNKPFALASDEEKASVSHRGRALRALVQQLR